MLASLIIPTHNRPAELAATLSAIESLDPAPLHAAGSVEIIVVDNNSKPAASIPRKIANGITVTAVRLPENRGAAARNDAAIFAQGQWLVMLDDDSSPTDHRFVEALQRADDDTAAICADIWLPATHDQPPRRESGGLPEVPVGCGVAYRRAPYLALHGYDPSFIYYAEEYDLAARLIAAGWRITHDHAFRVEHRKTTTNRNFKAILTRLLLNNTAVWQRYAPDDQLDAFLDREMARLSTIAQRENAANTYKQAERRLASHLAAQRRTPLNAAGFARFIGLTAARDALRAAHEAAPFTSAHLCLPPGPPGKHAEEIAIVLGELGVEPCCAPIHPEHPMGCALLIPATLAPGPMLNAAERFRIDHPRQRIVLAWHPQAGAARQRSAPSPSSLAAG